MSVEIPVSYVDQFSSNVHMLAEQRMSRLRAAVDYEAVTGDSFARERMGGIDAPNTVDELHGDTPLNSTPHTRRWGYIINYDVADLIDKQSKVALLIDPESRYTMRHAGTMGRGFDDAIISALGGTAMEGHTGSTSAALPSGQKITEGSTGMTVAKLLEAKRLLDAQEVDEFIPRYVVMGSTQFKDLLEDDKISNADYNTVKALVKGEIDTYLGFKFLRSERLLLSDSDTRLCYAWAQTGVLLGVSQEPVSVSAPRPDKRMASQIYTYGSWGAVRVEDEMVVEIPCDE